MWPKRAVPSRRRGCARRRSGPSAAGHYRRRRRPAAAGERRRLGLDRLQRRNLQLPRSAPPARRRRATSFAPTATPRRIVHLYEEEGPEFVKHLNGMFALALWDAKRQQLVLARDRLGKKPLVYRHEPGRLLFASELKSLLEVPGVPREIDPQALDEYLTYQYVPHPRTIFRGIAKLPPGHYRRVSRRPARRAAVLAAGFQRRGRLGPPPSMPRSFATLLTSAVEMRLQSEVPLGAFLSGGIDSTIIVGLMSQLAAEPVRTFSIGFPVKEFDETQLRPGGGRAVRHDPRRVSGSARRDGDLAAAGVALRRAVRRQLGRADVVRFATDSAAASRWR